MSSGTQVILNRKCATAAFGRKHPDATSEDIEHYLYFLVEDVGYQHLPYNDDDSRYPEGKSDMREGEPLTTENYSAMDVLELAISRSNLT
jgi:hypothetical protein